MDSPSERRSRVLSHPPADPGAEGSDEQWPAQSQVRLNLRLAGSPYIERRVFENEDGSSFTTSADPWTVTDGVLAPSVPGGQQVASFGEGKWEHFEARVELASLGVRAGLALGLDDDSSLIVWVEANAVRIIGKTGSQETSLASIAVPNAVPLTLCVTAFDDEIVARVGPNEVRAVRGGHRKGKLALLAEGGAAFSALRVDGLDAYRFEFAVSRFKDFADHIGSFDSIVKALPALGATAATPAGLKSEGAAFSDWVAALGIPLRTEIERLEISRHESGVLVIEGPEPLGTDVLIEVHAGGNSVPSDLISDETGTRLLIFPAQPLAGDVELRFTMSRERYRSSTADGTASLTSTASLHFRL